MGMDDGNEGGPGGCVEHLWQVAGATLGGDGATTEYECLRCGGLLVVEPGGIHPTTA